MKKVSYKEAIDLMVESRNDCYFCDDIEVVRFLSYLFVKDENEIWEDIKKAENIYLQEHKPPVEEKEPEKPMKDIRELEKDIKKNKNVKVLINGVSPGRYIARYNCKLQSTGDWLLGVIVDNGFIVLGQSVNKYTGYLEYTFE